MPDEALLADPSRAFLFDVFGTMVDWHGSVTRHVEAALPGIDAAAFTNHWRGLYQPAMDEVREGRRAYVPLDILHREMLDETLQSFGATLDDAAGFARVWERLDPWPDAVEGLARVRHRALVAPCSNGSIALISRLSRHAGFTWDAVLGADISRMFKPMEETYHRSCAAFGLRPDQVTMVACHEDDLASARSFGLRTAYIPRPFEHGRHAPRDASPTDDWDMIVDTIGALAR